MELDMCFQITPRAHGHLYPIGPTKMLVQSHLHRFVFLPHGPKFTVSTYFFYLFLILQIIYIIVLIIIIIILRPVFRFQK